MFDGIVYFTMFDAILNFQSHILKKRDETF